MTDGKMRNDDADCACGDPSFQADFIDAARYHRDHAALTPPEPQDCCEALIPGASEN